MSFFSIRSRHGDTSDPYPRKDIPPDLTLSVILLGWVPTTLALVGFVRTLGRHRLWPLAIFGAVTLLAYVWWVLPQPLWALKTKYLLFLLPQYTLYAVIGLSGIQRQVPAAALALAMLLVLLVVLAHVYLYAFAVGRLP